MAKRTPLSAAERFWTKVEKTETCWLWLASTDRDGYGRFGRTLAHRMAYELTVGPIPRELQIDHVCRVKRCVRPSHLEPVTSQENRRRFTVLITHCPRGHPYDEENTYRHRGYRFCRACNRAAVRRYKASRRRL
jgi:HNH endonuclease